MAVRLARSIAVAFLAASLTGLSFLPARGLSQLQRAEHHKHAVERAITKLRRDERTIRGVGRRALRRSQAVLSAGPSQWMGRDVKATWYESSVEALRLRQRVRHSLSPKARRMEHRVRHLVRKRRAIGAWIARWGILRTCPTRGTHQVTDNFGVMVRIKGVPPHIHQGNDIIAPYGTPVVAPFSGTAVAVPNPMGGLAVEVWGAQGYVYNAHLAQYGRLGAVHTGTVIGYVGATGDAGGPHDHFEWHPANGPASDPNPYLSVVC
jgi:murein DD-endopeptidase MepM/ murein hydrolase activator NlpD